MLFFVLLKIVSELFKPIAVVVGPRVVGAGAVAVYTSHSFPLKPVGHWHSYLESKPSSPSSSVSLPLPLHSHPTSNQTPPFKHGVRSHFIVALARVKVVLDIVSEVDVTVAVVYV
jgi:hypothetical protein